jgi:hypothetical protein
VLHSPFSVRFELFPELDVGVGDFAVAEVERLGDPVDARLVSRRKLAALSLWSE